MNDTQLEIFFDNWGKYSRCVDELICRRDNYTNGDLPSSVVKLNYDMNNASACAERACADMDVRLSTATTILNTHFPNEIVENVICRYIADPNYMTLYPSIVFRMYKIGNKSDRRRAEICKRKWQDYFEL